MINNFYENKKSANTNTAFKAALKTEDVNATGVAMTDKANNHDSGGGLVQTRHNRQGYHMPCQIIDGVNNNNNNDNANSNEIVNQQQSSISKNTNNNNNNKENIVNRNVWPSINNCNVINEQQKQQSHCTRINNECDIIIVDIEDDDNDNNKLQQQKQQQQQQQQQYNQQKPTYAHNLPSKFFMNANIKYSQKQSIIHYSERDSFMAKNYQTSCVNSSNNTQHIANDGRVNTANDNALANHNDERVDDDDEDDSLASMETLSDNVSIWIDGEKHWVAGVDANTTCSELIWALLNYQNYQKTSHEQHQHAFATATTLINEENIATTNSSQQQQLPKACDKNVANLNFRMTTCTNEEGTNASNATCTNNKPNIQNTAKPTNDTTTHSIRNFVYSNQSMPINTKENYEIIPDATLATAKTTITKNASLSPAIPIKQSSSSAVTASTLLPPLLPPGIATVTQLATEYVIVKQYHHCEEYLDGSTKVFDVLPFRNDSNRKECELLLRHLGPAPIMYINNTTPQLSSLISTDKDSGMGSPVGSARSAKFRRRKHKSSQWLAHANTLHPKLSRCTANERLMKIILAQDETIQRQLSLLREKERQITKIEEEKHRKRERELGKNYLLETYLNGLDEAECQPETQDGGEIFIDEQYRHTATAIPTAVVTLTTTRDKIPLATETLNMMAKHKHKDKEVKKEKKKKRHRDKHPKNEEIHANDFILKTNKNSDKEKVQIPRQHHLDEQQAMESSSSNNKDNGNEKEIEFQIFWLEKIFTLNKQLQKEEELAAKLHAKVRKHQLRKAQQTQQEVQTEIDKLDNNLALQCGDIRKVEANLMETNEQLQKKLHVLERLSLEYLHEQQENEPLNRYNELKSTHGKQTIKHTENPLKDDTNTLLNNLEKSLDTQKLSLNNIKTKEEVIKLEKILAKPSIDGRQENSELKETKQLIHAVIENMPSTKTTLFQTNPRLTNVNSQPENHNVTFSQTTNNNPQQHHHYDYYHHHLHHEELTTSPITTDSSAAGLTVNNEEIRSNDTMSTSCMLIDKNMLSSLHVQNAKTIKKQMFHTQPTAIETVTAASPSASASTSAEILSPTTQLPLTMSGFPGRQFQHAPQPHMPMTSTFLTSRPQDSHQIQAKNILIVQQPATTHFSCSASSPPPSAPALAQQPSILATTTATAAAPTFLLKVQQRPPISISPSPSIMAMNTVDISQLGTLV